jgi:ABC-type glutathione transport system ATPase component
LTAPVLAARGVSFSYEKGRTVLSEIEFELAPGEVVGLVGESGSGKSTLGRLLAGLHEPDAGEVVGADADVQMIFQDPYAALNPRMTPFDAVNEVFRAKRRLDRGSASNSTRELLQQVGLGGEAMSRQPRRLSGGQCQRVSIARSLAADPSVLIADEPTSSLDVSVQAQILNLLRSIQARRELSVVLVSHDLAVIRYMAERTYVMYRGEIVESGPTDALYAAPKHPYTRKLLEAAPGRRPGLQTIDEPSR